MDRPGTARILIVPNGRVGHGTCQSRVVPCWPVWPAIAWTLRTRASWAVELHAISRPRFQKHHEFGPEYQHPNTAVGYCPARKPCELIPQYSNYLGNKNIISVNRVCTHIECYVLYVNIYIQFSTIKNAFIYQLCVHPRAKRPIFSILK